MGFVSQIGYRKYFFIRTPVFNRKKPVTTRKVPPVFTMPKTIPASSTVTWKQVRYAFSPFAQKNRKTTMPDPTPALTIPTARLMLVLQSPSEVLAWVESLPPSDRAEISSDWLDLVREAQPHDPWSLGFRILETGTGLVVGACMFKGPPKEDGIVEIAYGIDPPWQGCGFATEAATGLAVFAKETGLVRVVCAHTRADNPASIRVLQKSGFLPAGEIIDPVDGPLLRWEKY